MPKKIEKLILKNYEFIKEYFNVYGRKIRLHEIRKPLLERLKPYMRYSDESYYQTLPMDQCTILLQRYNLSVIEDDVNQVKQAIKEAEKTRHFSIWQDAATVANHGYVLFMIQNIYDPAVYYTNTEWHAKYPNKTATSIPKIIEQPEIYMIGQCSSSDEDQLHFCETRTECLQELSSTLFTYEDMEIKDVLRFFKGDGPATGFETGHQKGGHFPCSSSEIRADRIFDFSHSVYSKHLTLEYMQSIILSGGVSKEDTLKKQIAPCHNLSKQDLQEELFSHNIKVATTKPKKDLEILLINKMRGCKRVPAILYDQP